MPGVYPATASCLVSTPTQPPSAQAPFGGLGACSISPCTLPRKDKYLSNPSLCCQSPSQFLIHYKKRVHSFSARVTQIFFIFLSRSFRKCGFVFVVIRKATRCIYIFSKITKYMKCIKRKGKVFINGFTVYPSRHLLLCTPNPINVYICIYFKEILQKQDYTLHTAFLGYPAPYHGHLTHQNRHAYYPNSKALGNLTRSPFIHHMGPLP